MENYEVVKDLGAGNFGVARLMRHKDTKELVAMKYIERGLKVLWSASRVSFIPTVCIRCNLFLLRLQFPVRLRVDLSPSPMTDDWFALYDLQIDENVAREIINHRSLRHPNIIRFKEAIRAICSFFLFIPRAFLCFFPPMPIKNSDQCFSFVLIAISAGRLDPDPSGNSDGVRCWGRAFRPYLQCWSFQWRWGSYFPSMLSPQSCLDLDQSHLAKRCPSSLSCSGTGKILLPAAHLGGRLLSLHGNDREWTGVQHMIWHLYCHRQ